MNQQRQTPVTIIGGYLGCGKTTLVNQLLRHANGTRLAILVNDFGELPIDADLIEAEQGDVISLTGGCVCCSYGDDLSTALINLLTLSPLPDHIVIEASGVALPGAIGNSITLQRSLTLRSIVVLADIATLQTNAQDKYLADTIDRQLKDADLIILNKLDLVTPATALKTQSWVKNSYPDRCLLTTVNSQVAAGILLDDHRPAAIDNQINVPASDHNPSIFHSVELAIQGRIDIRALAARLSDQECGLVRAKGFVNDLDGTTKTLQVVGRRWSVDPAPKDVSTGIVCIGKTNEFNERSIRQYCDLDKQ